jgi:NAD(P)-dependent dehydrogenase (short-subunit alcohol dehydrogenase family)
MITVRFNMAGCLAFPAACFLCKTMSNPPTALIGGITGGIGRTLGQQLSNSGWNIAGYARNEARLAELAATHADWLLAPVDATRRQAIDHVVQATTGRHGRIDAYFHCIGSILLKPAHLTKPEEWTQTLELNLTSAFLALQAVLGPMQIQGGGCILFVSSVAAQIGLPNHEAIAAAKGGLDALVRSAAATYAPKNIRVNAVAPGLVDTPLAAMLLGSDTARQVSEKMHPLGRVGRPANIASLLAWLATPDADWVTGQVWSVDGGMAGLRAKPKI